MIPSWNEVDYFDGSRWLNQTRPGEASLSGYIQSLDTFREILNTRYDWLDSNRATHIEVTMFLVRQEPHLAVTQLRITPDYGVTAGPITFSFPLGAPPGATFAWEGATLPDAIPIREARMPTAAVSSPAWRRATERSGWRKRSA